MCLRSVRQVVPCGKPGRVAANRRDWPGKNPAENPWVRLSAADGRAPADWRPEIDCTGSGCRGQFFRCPDGVTARIDFEVSVDCALRVAPSLVSAAAASASRFLDLSCGRMTRRSAIRTRSDDVEAARCEHPRHLRLDLQRRPTRPGEMRTTRRNRVPWACESVTGRIVQGSLSSRAGPSYTDRMNSSMPNGQSAHREPTAIFESRRLEPLHAARQTAAIERPIKCSNLQEVVR